MTQWLDFVTPGIVFGLNVAPVHSRGILDSCVHFVETGYLALHGEWNHRGGVSDSLLVISAEKKG